MSARADYVLLPMLDCPACRRDQGLLAQRQRGRSYLACPSCRFFYPIVDEVFVLLPPERNPTGFYEELGPPADLGIEKQPPRDVDLKALVYSFHARMDECGRAFDVAREPLVVDVGCSTGSFASWLGANQTYVGLDLSIASLRFARRASGQFFVQADAERLPLKTQSVPFFVSREVLEHLGNPNVAARELARVAQRGVVVVPTLDFPFLYDPLNWVLVRRGRRARFGVYGYGHRELHDIAGWRGLLEDGGFTVLSERPIGTGVLLNATDVLWHSLFSWRDFDGLPRRGAPIGLARAVQPVERALHRLEAKVLPSRALSHGFEVRPRADGVEGARGRGHPRIL